MILFGLIAESPYRDFSLWCHSRPDAGWLVCTYIFFVADKVGGKAEPVVGMHQFVKPIFMLFQLI